VLLPSCKEDRIEEADAANEEVNSLAQSIMVHSNQDPIGALNILDSIENKKLLPQWRADRLRFNIYLNDSLFYINEATALVEKDLADSSLKVSQDVRLQMFLDAAHCRVTLGDYPRAMIHAIRGQRYAAEYGDLKMEAVFKVINGASQHMLGSYNKAWPTLESGVKYLEQHCDDKKSLGLLSFAYGQQMNSAWTTHTDVAIRVGLKRDSVINLIESYNIDPFYVDRERGFLYSKLADMYAKFKDTATAAEYCRKYYATRFANTLRGKQAILNYYQTIGDDENLIKRYNESKNYWNHKDTLCNRFITQLAMISGAYERQGDYKEALRYGKKSRRVTALLQKRQRAEEDELDIMLAKAANDKLDVEKGRTRQFVKAALLALFIALAFFIVAILIYINRRSLKKEHDALASDLNKHIEEQKLQEEQKQLKEAAQSEKIKDKVIEFNRLIDEDKVYLNSDLSRPMLEQMLGVNKNTFSLILKEVIGEEGNLSDFIAKKRIEYALQLMHDDPDLDMEDVATKAGFYTMRSFRRHFKEKMGMSPTEYRQTNSNG